MWPWLVKFASGFAIFNGEKVGKILWVVAIAGTLLGAYNKLFVQKTTTTVDRSTQTATFAGATIQHFVAKQEVVASKEKLWTAEVGVGMQRNGDDGKWGPIVEFKIGRKF